MGEGEGDLKAITSRSGGFQPTWGTPLNRNVGPTVSAYTRLDFRFAMLDNAIFKSPLCLRSATVPSVSMVKYLYSVGQDGLSPGLQLSTC